MNNEQPTQQFDSMNATAPKHSESERIILDLPSEILIGRCMDAVQITPKRITVGSNTFSLTGVSGVKLEQNHLRRSTWQFWLGWIVVAAIFLPGISGNYAVICGFIGGMLVWENRKQRYATTQILLEKGGKRELCFQVFPGMFTAQDTSHYESSDERTKRGIEQYLAIEHRARTIAEKLGEALG